MKLAVTVLAHRRPEYLRRTLEALAACHKAEGWRTCIVMDDPDQATRMLARRHPGAEIVELHTRRDDQPYARISRATLYALALGFATADFVAHLEEDCIPSPDWLEFMAAMAARYRGDPTVFTVSGWWGGAPDPLRDLYRTGLDPWFVPWGWGTWADRFAEMRAQWDLDGGQWDIRVNEIVRGDRLTAFPAVSRIRDIGEQGSNPSAQWRDRQRRTKPAFAPDTPHDQWVR